MHIIAHHQAIDDDAHKTGPGTCGAGEAEDCRLKAVGHTSHEPGHDQPPVIGF